MLNAAGRKRGWGRSGASHDEPAEPPAVTMHGADGPLVIDGLWALTIGNGAAGGSLNTLYYTAGPDGESHGLFGSLAVVPELSTWAMMLAGFAGLGLAAYRKQRTNVEAA